MGGLQPQRRPRAFVWALVRAHGFCMGARAWQRTRVVLVPRQVTTYIGVHGCSRGRMRTPASSLSPQASHRVGPRGYKDILLLKVGLLCTKTVATTRRPVGVRVEARVGTGGDSRGDRRAFAWAPVSTPGDARAFAGVHVWVPAGTRVSALGNYLAFVGARGKSRGHTRPSWVLRELSVKPI